MRGCYTQLDPSDKAIGRAQPPHPNPLPQGEREFLDGNYIENFSEQRSQRNFLFFMSCKIFVPLPLGPRRETLEENTEDASVRSVVSYVVPFFTKVLTISIGECEKPWGSRLP